MLATSRGRLAALGDVDARSVDLAERRRRAGLRRTGWALLERGLGPEGVQALEIDAAGPEVARLTNELLTACYGGRFSVELRTIRPADGGKKQREVLEIAVVDGERGGTARPFEGYSGGEQVIVDEAVKLGIALFNAARTGGAFECLWRDEADGRLDPANARRYPAMLRRALELGGFRHVFFVTHRPEVWAQADTTIRVGGGRVSVES